MAIYIGIDGKARKVVAGYVGSGGTAQPIYKSDILPSDYQQVYYISNESSSDKSHGAFLSFFPVGELTQYTRVYMTFSTGTGNQGSGSTQLFYYSNNATINIEAGTDDNVGKFCLKYVLGSLNNYTSWIGKNIETNHTIDFNNRGKIILDGTTIATNTAQWSAANMNILTDNTYNFVRIKNVKVYENYNYNTLLADAYPCYNKIALAADEEGEVHNRGNKEIPAYTGGLYDIVRKKFYAAYITSYYTYEFAYGNPIPG